MKKDRLLSARVLLIIVCLCASTWNFSSADGVDRSSTGTELSAIVSLKARFIDSRDLLHDWKVQDGFEANRSAHCNWTGISCSSDGAVTKIDLSGMNLTGTVSDDIQHLRNLESLNLCRNGFFASLPESITGLENLRVVDVSENAFVGTLPVCLSLATLNASGNNLGGVIPEDLGNASSLESLDLRGNFFEGSIPASFKNLQRLRFLGLSGNNFSGDIPPVLGQLSGLQSLILGYNSFSGGIPAEFGNLTDLRYLDVAESNLSGQIPTELGKMKQLDTIFLYRNSFHGRIPDEIGNMSSLSFIDFSDNLITGEIPASVAELKNLKLLNLMSNEISGSVPPPISKLTQLRVLALWNNSISGRLPIDLGLNSPLQSLDVSSNSFSGEIPVTLCNSGNLTKLILFRNNFSGPIPTTLTRCGSLVRVRIQNNRISRTIPTGFGELKLLQRLELAKNSLTGEIPFDLGFSTSLSFIDISSNDLRSSLPSNLFSVRTLQTFLASNCSLRGEIAIPNGFNASLSVLDLSENHLSGEIPANITAFRRLVNLNISSNKLSGEIPKGIATMPMLSIMDVSRNSLTGKIPENLGTSPALETVNVSHNNLEGPVPQNGVLRNINPSNLAGNEGLCGAGTTTLKNETRPRRRHSAATTWIIGISVMAAAIAAASLVKSLWNSSFNSDKKKELPWRLIAFQKLDFTSYDILSCVNESNVIGIGATGIVYRAEVRSGPVAVKKLWRSEVQTRMKNSDDDLAGEVNLLGRLRHRNIVRLLGFAHNSVDTMIIYEYMKNGNLREALHGEETGRLLVDWVSRYNVTIDVAQGLAYLHHDCHPRVIHRDIKSSNILLDENLEARIADFGLARMIGKKNEPVSTVAGSYGYIAPEYGFTLKVDEKSDVYSYGVVLLELVTGKPAVAAEFGDGGDVVEWIRRRSRGGRCLESVLDESIGGESRHVREEMMLVLRIALICTARLPRDRPSMRDVITMLEEAKPRRKSSTDHPSF